ncbi:MAG: MBOAT family protein [Alphaproteobacteria bacterium]|nr:MBOAT family protein [Alphaproteobacteria bacterium]
MLFHSHLFLFGFLPVLLLGFFVLGRFNPKWAAAWLGLGSLFFYGFWSIKALPLLLGSIIVNYMFGLKLARPSSPDNAHARKSYLIFALILNLGLLGFFKYAHFFIENTNQLLEAADLHLLPTLTLILPIGISFFTFTQIAFLVDCYQGKVRETSFIHYLVFVTYFPHLIAGPVLHHLQMMPQFSKPDTYRVNADKIALGIAIIAIGLAKKMLVADPLGEYANTLFNAVPHDLHPTLWVSWLGVLSYTMQIYFDFSGYSDMAIGLSLLFGIYLPINFNSPYKATSMIDFWRRWHISLSSFLRDYLYFPLGGNQKGKVRRYVNLLVTMILGGLWHGASWTFVLWGAAHGLFLVINHAWRTFIGSERTYLSLVAKTVSWPVTFLSVCFTWVIFRANSVSEALPIYKGMLGLNGIGTSAQINPGILAYILIALVIALRFKNTQELFSLHEKTQSDHTVTQSHNTLFSLSIALIAIVLFWISVLKIGGSSPFLYFQF